MQALVKMCTGASLVAALPSMAHQIISPSPGGLLMGMANSALAFFLFSYQVCLLHLAVLFIEANIHRHSKVSIKFVVSVSLHVMLWQEP